MEHTLPSLVLSSKQQPQFALTYTMQQSLHVLQLPIVELGEWVKEEIEKNPLLEFGEEKGELGKTYSLENKESEPPSLFTHLMKQAEEIFSTTEELLIAEEIIGNLDERGFLTLPLAECTKQVERAQEIVKKIQTLDPAGIAASNLQASLLLQLERKNQKKNLSYTLIEQHYDDLLHNRLGTLAQKLNCSIKKIKTCIQNEIKSLNLHPGYFFRKELSLAIYPDIIITQEAEKFDIEINENLIPSFYIKNCEECNSCEYQPYYNSAHWLLHILEKRKITLTKIAQFLIKTQMAFFSENTRHPLPMTLKEVAEATQLHTSTISRAIADKYLSCSQGILPLRDLFTLATKKEEKGSDREIKEKLCQLIEQENKKLPYSDEALSFQLKKRGFSCARRTITKYRQALNIPHASLRKEW